MNAKGGRSAVGLILYSPFDMENITGGGTTFEFGERNQNVILQEAFGFDPNAETENSEADLKVLRILENIPSLDPFLLKDKIDAEGFEIQEGYFSISEEEFANIKEYIIEKFRPITEKVVGSDTPQARQHSEEFIMKLWEGKDLDYLAPITQVFQLDPDQASEIYYSWKGLSYYEFQYRQLLDTLLRFADWLQNKSQPSHYVKPDQQKEFQMMTEGVLTQFAGHLQQSSSILRSYNQAYTELFVHGGDSKPFIQILNNSSDLFWTTSASLSAINHAIMVWKQKTAHKKEGKLIADELRDLLQTLGQVIA